MASRGIAFRLSAVSLVLLVLGNECAGVSAKRQTRKERGQADEPTEAIGERHLPAPTNLKVEVSCDNIYNATWDYDFEANFDGFMGTLCHKDECATTHIDYKDREFTRRLPSHNSSYTFTLYAIDSQGRRSDSDVAEFTSFPKLPHVQGLTVNSTSPTELQTHLLKGLEPGTTYEVSAQTVVTVNNRTCEGEPAKKSGTTLQLEPPKNLTVDVSCGNDAHIKWTYDDVEPINGFFVMLCHGREAQCENKTLPNDQTECSFRLPDYNATYNVSVRSYRQTLFTDKTYSKPVQETIVSLPELPELDDIVVTGVSETALVATWTTKWDGEITFNICSMPEECQNHTILGTPRKHTFDQLASNTTYRVRAQSQVTLQKKKCRGHLQERSASTFTERPGEVRNVQHSVENGTILQASWELPEKASASGFTVKCEDPQTKYTESRDVFEPKAPRIVSLWLFKSRVATDGIACPENLKLVERNATSFTLSWSVDPNATKCEITVTPEKGFDEELTKLENACEHDKPLNGTVMHTVTGLQPWTRYNVTVKNCREAFCGLPAFLINITEVAAPSKVRNFTYNKAETSNQTIYGPESQIQFETLGKGPLPPRPKPKEVKEDSVHLSWEEPHDPRYNITGFSIRVNNQPPVEINQSSYTIDHLTPWTEYNVSVASCTKRTSCGQWRHLEVKTDFAAPSAPLDLKAPEAGTDWMLVQWEKPKVFNGPLSGYNVTFQPRKQLSVCCHHKCDATTQAQAQKASVAVVVVAVVVPLIFIILIAAYFVYKKFQKRTGERTPLRSAEGM
ncbi:hypothetical protein MRX96_040249 [Rhipicephalus microplus]